jgi:heat shock protein HslJ
VPFRQSHRAVSRFSLASLLGLVLLAAGASIATAQVPIQVPPPSTTPPPTTTTTVAPAQLTQTTWRWLRSEYSDDSVVDVNNPDNYTVRFNPDGTLAARADCNQIVGTYEQSGSSLTIHLGPSTLVACPPDSQADVFTRDLQIVVTYVLRGGTLFLNMRFDIGNMVFEPQRVPSLTDTTWQVQSYNNGRGGVVTVQTGTELTAMFGADGMLSGSAGCNTYNGTYTVDGSDMSIGPLATTRRACPEPIMQQEGAYLAALAATSQYTLTADRLTLRSADGATQVVLVPAS